MRLVQIADIWSGYLNRVSIDPREGGTHYLIQARDADGEELICRTGRLVRFDASLSPSDCLLEENDILFMARGPNNFAVQVRGLPRPALAAACFFVIRLRAREALPEYVTWYLNESRAQQYILRSTARGVHMPVVQRVVLENLDVDLPPVETQQKVAGLAALMSQERHLLQDLLAKRKELVSSVCLRAVAGDGREAGRRAWRRALEPE